MQRIFLTAFLLTSLGWAAPASSPTIEAGHGLNLTVQMVSPTAAECDLQIICVFKHNPAGDKYIEAMQEFDDKLGHLVSELRNNGQFVGELGETMLFQTPEGSITPPQVLLIGLGPENQLSLESLRLVGRVAVREAVRLRAARVSFAPTIRDQGNTSLDVGEGDAAVAEQLVLAYDTEKRLQARGLSSNFSLQSWVIDAGPKFFEGASSKVERAVAQARRQAQSRDH
ncbi:peptidase M17 [bacterium]|nr:peptidase M17 [bacterium]